MYAVKLEGLGVRHLEAANARRARRNARKIWPKRRVLEVTEVRPRT